MPFFARFSPGVWSHLPRRRGRNNRRRLPGGRALAPGRFFGACHFSPAFRPACGRICPGGAGGINRVFSPPKAFSALGGFVFGKDFVIFRIALDFFLTMVEYNCFTLRKSALPRRFVRRTAPSPRFPAFLCGRGRPPLPQGAPERPPFSPKGGARPKKVSSALLTFCFLAKKVIFLYAVW